MKKKVFKGIAASEGIIHARAFVFDEEEVNIKIVNIKSKKLIKREIIRFKEARAKTKKDLVKTHKKVLKELGKKHARLFYAYQLILDDTLFNDDIFKKIKTGVNAEYAVSQNMNKVSLTFGRIQDEYLREREHDILDVGKKLLNHLLGKSKTEMKDFDSPVVIIAHDITPSDTIVMKGGFVKGFATDIGGKTSHTAILAHSLEIAAVVGLHDITQYVKTGDDIIIDGYKGVAIINPTSEVIEQYEKRKKRIEVYEKELEKIRDLPAITTDKKEVELLANIEIPGEIKSVKSHGAKGVGLFRTEYLYLNRKNLPDEEEQFKSYKLVAESIAPNPVTIRTLDLGGDKLSTQLHIAPERNPFLGLRGIRLCLKFPELFKTQLRAILRATNYGNLKIMYPMVSGVEEIKQANKLLEEVKKELQEKKIPVTEAVQVGVMIEVPSAVLLMDIFLREVDFVSIGTNDLIQYTLAIDRVNENVADLYKPDHLAVIRALKIITDFSKKYKKPVSMCGEMAADPYFIKILIGLGLKELSMSSISIPKVKNAICSFSYKDAENMTKEILETEDQETINKILKKEN